MLKHPLMFRTYLTRVYHFSAAHRYWRDEWTPERNRTVFGACSNEHGHGHHYTLEVTVAGEPDAATGFSVDVGELDEMVRGKVISVLDHHHLNYVVPEFAAGGKIPTTENIARWVWEQAGPHLAGARLVRVRLREDQELWVDLIAGREPDATIGEAGSAPR